MKIKTNELTGAALDYAVSLITNPEWTDEDRAMNTYDYVDTGDLDDEPYMPSEDWAQGGPIIQRERINLSAYELDERGDLNPGWQAFPNSGMSDDYECGPTPLIAAMRCFVASKLGDEVEIPDELTRRQHETILGRRPNQ